MPAAPSSLRSLAPVGEPAQPPDSPREMAGISLSGWGRFIRRRRLDLDVPQSAAARRAGIPQSTASQIERDGPASLHSLRAYVEALGLAVALVDPACIPGEGTGRADGGDMRHQYTLLTSYSDSAADRLLDAAFEAHGQLAGILADLGAGRHRESVYRLGELAETVAQAARLAQIAAEVTA